MSEQLAIKKDLRSRKHGHSIGRTMTTEFGIWVNIRQRCYNPKNPRYHRYGGRGISVCKRWDEFAAFLQDMGPRPSRDFSVERKDNDGPYSPENCEWATRQEQGNNTSTSRLMEFQGRTMCITQWARELGIPRATITNRLRSGWPIDKALGTPSRPTNLNYLKSK